LRFAVALLVIWWFMRWELVGGSAALFYAAVLMLFPWVAR